MAVKRGRKTDEERARVRVLPQRPKPPETLTEAQKAIWNRTTGALPPDWFRDETLYILEQYCRHITTAQMVGERLAALPADAPLSELDTLTRMQEREAARITSLATKMRITLQATYDREKVKRNDAPAADPWQTAQG